ncbi:MAG: thymidine phosphorylase [Chloroflexi bacterium]|nr:thymidine phosphorylase [Chloroflexota bacterium]
MRAVDIIAKKRDGEELTAAEIDFFIQGYTQGDIPDYQAAAWCMAVLLKGMTPAETTELTLSMARSGTQLDLSDVAPLVADKHSTGGVGDKVTLALMPLVAAAGQPVGKMSGRGLGFSGGTLDKLESIPGWSGELSTAQFKQQIREIGLVIAGQTADLAPADKKLYALRDVTATVPSLPLIASSVMSKKIAAGANVILLDVKVGNGAFMQTLEAAVALAERMVAIGRLAGRRVAARVTDMNQPLGYAIGNALEVKEAIATLRGEGPADFNELILGEAAHLLKLCDVVDSLAEGRSLAEAKLADGSALSKFAAFVEAQGGDPRVVDDPDRLLAQAPVRYLLESPREGYLSAVHARTFGITTVLLGGGRAKKGDPIDHRVGIILHAKIGDRVKKGQPLCEIHARTDAEAEQAATKLLDAYAWSDDPVTPPPLLKKTIHP